MSFWQIDVFSVCQCTTSAFRPISKPTLIKWFVWVTFMEENGQVKGLANGKKVLFITSRGVEFEAGLLKDGIVRNLRSGMLFNTWV